MKKRFVITLRDKFNGVEFDMTATDLRVEGHEVYVYSSIDKINKFLLSVYDFSVRREELYVH